jgi:acyl carrier protein
MNTLEQDIQAGVFRIVAETFPDHAAPLSPHTLVKQDLGADSMQLISLMIALDAEFDAEFPVENIPSEDVTLEWVCRFVHDTLLSSRSST